MQCTHNVIKDVTELVDSDKKTPDSFGQIQYKHKTGKVIITHSSWFFKATQKRGGGGCVKDLGSGLHMDGFLFSKITGKTMPTRD